MPTYMQLLDSNKNLVMGPCWVPDTKADWPTDHQLQHDFDLKRGSVYEETAFMIGAERFNRVEVSRELLRLKHEDSMGTQRKGDICCWKLLPENR
jgi:hypothetical protein